MIDVNTSISKTDLVAIFSAPETYSIQFLYSRVEWKLPLGVTPQNWSMMTIPAMESPAQKTGPPKYPPHELYELSFPSEQKARGKLGKHDEAGLIVTVALRRVGRKSPQPIIVQLFMVVICPKVLG